MNTFNCPYCNGLLEVVEFNCKIFRHGYIKSTMKQISPHSNQAYVDKLRENNDLIGCGMPFRAIIVGDEWIIEKCGWDT